MVLNSAVPVMRRWGQGRLLEAEEEDYFNNSDEEETTPTKTSPWSPLISLGSVNILKRKRGKGFTSISAKPPSKHSRPTPVKPRPIQGLVDYDEDDDSEGSSGASSSKIHEPASEKLLSSLSPPRQIDWFAETQALDDPPLSKNPHSASSSSSRQDHNSQHHSAFDPSPPPRSIRPDDSPPRLGEKRRRHDEDDEDEMLERLVKSKKPSLGGGLAAAAASSPSSSSVEKEDVKSASLPKSAASGGKMKLKLGASSFSMASASASTSSPRPGGTPPENEKKDADSG